MMRTKDNVDRYLSRKAVSFNIRIFETPSTALVSFDRHPYSFGCELDYKLCTRQRLNKLIKDVKLLYHKELIKLKRC